MCCGGSGPPDEKIDWLLARRAKRQFMAADEVPSLEHRARLRALCETERQAFRAYRKVLERRAGW